MRQAAATAAVPNLQSSSACCSRAHSRSKNETAAAEVRGCSWNDSQVCTAREFARVGGALGAGERGRGGGACGAAVGECAARWSSGAGGALPQR